MRNVQGKMSIWALAGLLALTMVARLHGQGTNGREIQLSLVAPEAVPEHGTFVLFSHAERGFGPPLPWNPFAGLGLDVYRAGSNTTPAWLTNALFVDDTTVDWPAVWAAGETNIDVRKQLSMLWLPHRAQQLRAQAATNGGEEMELMSCGQYSMESEEEEGGESGPMELAYTTSTNELYLEVTDRSRITNGWIGVTLHNTIPDLAYDLLYRLSLTNGAGWTVDQPVTGAPETNSTFTWVSMIGRTNQLFLWARSYDDVDGDGLPSWWELKYGLDPNNSDTGNTGIPDGYKDLAGDGSTVLWKYENGKDPRQAILFPPRNVRAVVDSSGSNVVVTWESAGGAATGYGVEQGYGPYGLAFRFEIYSNNATILTFTNHFANSLSTGVYLTPRYVVRAYSGTNRADSQVVSPVRSDLPGDSVFRMRGPHADTYLMVQSPAPDLGRIMQYEFPSESPITAYASNLVNGVVKSPISEGDLGLYGLYGGMLLYSTNGTFGTTGENFYESDRDRYNPDTAAYRFVDARRHMKENLRFLLRAATVNHAYRFTADQDTFGGYGWDPSTDEETTPELYFARRETSTNYEYYGFHMYDPTLGYSFMQELRPIYDNYLFRNFAFDETLSGLTGAFSFDYCSGEITRQIWGAYYTYVSPGNETNAPVSLDSTNSAFSFVGYTYDVYSDCYVLPESGLSVAGTNLAFAAGTKNCFGLSIASVKYDGVDGVQTVSPGNVGNLAASEGGYVYLGTDVPDLQITNYYFASQLPYFTYITSALEYTSDLPAPPFPGAPSFSPTNAQPMLIASFGQPFTIAGWAKMAIANGYAGKYAYLEQYWDKAFKIGTNGVATTNQTGVLSPYGEFFPTEPGPAALVTMPDIDSGQRGTGVVNVIKLQLDVNHDGVMDLSFGGPDNTSPERPFEFWVNNDHDVPSAGGTFSNPLDHDIENGPADFSRYNIHCARNLEDFARLWICGVPSLPDGYTVGVSLESISGSPSLNIYLAAEVDGGIGYLTNALLAGFTVTNGASGNAFLAVIPGYDYIIPNGFFNGTNRYFLFEGAGEGKGQLVLTIRKGTNVIAQTSAWLDLKDVKQMYEQSHITNVFVNFPQMVEESATSGFAVDFSPQVSGFEEKQIAVFVHGWRLTARGYQNFSDTMFKRLYWQGFRGRFASPFWPTLSADQVGKIVDFLTFNQSEHVALESGPGMAAYFLNLRSRFPQYRLSVCSHSQGATVMAETLRDLASAGQDPIENYVMMQGAFPAQAYDSGVTNYPLFDLIEQVVPTPNSYLNYAENVADGVHGLISSFLNTNDFALQIWNNNNFYFVPQTNGYFTMKPTSMFGYGTDGTGSWLSNSVTGTSRAVTNVHELLPFVARARSFAVGAQPGVGGAVNGNEVDLQTQFGFTGEYYDHSGEFNRAIQEAQGFLFYGKLFQELFPPLP